MLELNKIYCGDCLDLMKEIGDKSVDLVLTDPPYGIDIANNPIRQMHDKKGWDIEIPTKEYFDEIFRISNNQVIFGGNYFNLPPTQCFLIWDKRQPETFTTSMCEFVWTSFISPAKLFRYRVVDGIKKDHPTQKPVALFRWILEKYSEPNMTILDPFAGSCTTALACIKTGRNFICIDKEPQYCEIGERRVAALPNTKLDKWF
jgi:site-specific DNA-methyltransferase (adenine-specific)